MAAKKSKVPEGYQSVTPYLRVKGAAEAIAYYQQAFGAKERFRLTMGERLGHAEITIGDCAVMLSDEFPEMGIVGPKALGGTPCVLSIYVADTDTVFEAAIAAGATAKRPPTDEFYGDRTAQIEDPFGHLWSIQQRLEDIPPAEMQRRLDQMMTTGTYAAKDAKAAATARPKSAKADQPKPSPARTAGKTSKGKPTAVAKRKS